MNNSLTLTRVRLKETSVNEKDQFELRWEDLLDFYNSLPPVTERNDSLLIKNGIYDSIRDGDHLKRLDFLAADYDEEKVPMEEAARRLREAGIAALVHPTWKWEEDKPRYRIFAPLDAPISGTKEQMEACYKNRMDQLDKALGGILAKESWITAQNWFMSRRADKNQPEPIVIEGKPIGAAANDDTEWLRNLGPEESNYKADKRTDADIIEAIRTTSAELHPEILLLTGRWARQDLPDYQYQALKMLLIDAIHESPRVKAEPSRGNRLEKEIDEAYNLAIEKGFGAEPPAAWEEQGLPHPLLRSIDIDELPPAETFLVDNILCDQLSVFASYPGKGKTSAWVTLCAVVCGAIKVPGLEVEEPRHVIYSSEHPEQVIRILHALKSRYEVDTGILRERFHVAGAVKMDVKQLVSAAKDLVGLYTIRSEKDGTILEVPPYVVLDTASASLAIEEENSNSEWSRIVAHIKQEFLGIPTSIVTHTSKEHKRGDPKTMTVRGASAIEGDTNQVLYLSEDKDDPTKRFIEIGAGKHRFDTDIDALELVPATYMVPTTDRRGRTVDQRVLTVGLEPLTREERAEAKAEATKQKKEEQTAVDAKTILNWLEEHNDDYPTKNDIEVNLKGEVSQKRVRAAVKHLLDRGAVTTEDIPAEHRKMGGKRAYLAVSETSSDDF